MPVDQAGLQTKELTMKITDDGLIYRIWLTQLRILSKRVLNRYIGGGVGVCKDSNFDYFHASSIHIVERHKITDKLGSQHLRKRVVRLVEDGFLFWAHRNLTFMVNTEQSKKAFEAAREFMLSKGIATGWDDSKKCMRTSQIDDLESLTKECYQYLLKSFRTPDWEQIYQAQKSEEGVSHAN